MKSGHILNIIFICFICYIFYLIYTDHKNKKLNEYKKNMHIGQHEQFKPIKSNKCGSILYDNNNLNHIIQEHRTDITNKRNITNKTNKTNGTNKTKKSVSFQIEKKNNDTLLDLDGKQKNRKPYFSQMQFHTDYRDTITAFNNIAPSQKEVFNQSDMPSTFSKLSKKNKIIQFFVSEFIRQLNEEIRTNVYDTRHANTGWDELAPDPKEKSGWEKQQEELGLPTSLYSEPAKKAPIYLIDIDDAEEYKTEDETKYVCTIVIQKQNVDDQMIAKISFIRSNVDLDVERNFFNDILNKNKKAYDPTFNIVIEEIFIVGFLTDTKQDIGNKYDEFYNFDGLNYNDVMSDKIIMKELIKKYAEKHEEDKKFSRSLDKETRFFHDNIRDITTYKSYKNSRSIYDDLMGKEMLFE